MYIYIYVNHMFVHEAVAEHQRNLRRVTMIGVTHTNMHRQV